MVVSELLTQTIYISLFLNKPMQCIGIENYKTNAIIYHQHFTKHDFVCLTSSHAHYFVRIKLV